MCQWLGGGGIEQKIFSMTGCFLVLFKNEGRRVGPRFYILVSDIYQKNEEAG